MEYSSYRTVVSASDWFVLSRYICTCEELDPLFRKYECWTNYVSNIGMPSRCVLCHWLAFNASIYKLNKILSAYFDPDLFWLDYENNYLRGDLTIFRLKNNHCLRCKTVYLDRRGSWWIIGTPCWDEVTPRNLYSSAVVVSGHTHKRFLLMLNLACIRMHDSDNITSEHFFKIKWNMFWTLASCKNFCW